MTMGMARILIVVPADACLNLIVQRCGEAVHMLDPTCKSE